MVHLNTVYLRWIYDVKGGLIGTKSGGFMVCKRVKIGFNSGEIMVLKGS